MTKQENIRPESSRTDDELSPLEKGTLRLSEISGIHQSVLMQDVIFDAAQTGTPPEQIITQRVGLVNKVGAEFPEIAKDMVIIGHSTAYHRRHTGPENSHKKS